jgi:uncharacterized caspase-like protein
MDGRGRRNSTRSAARLPALFVLASLAGGPAHAADALYGLVVGIDDYLGTVNDLQGAVNDAVGIASALRAAGADDVIELHDGAATKAAIRAGWERLVAKAEPTDTIVFTYAGHGAQEPEPPGRGGEDDGLNENFLLGGYQKEGPGSLERIVDDEMFEWLKEADDKGVEVVLVADSCHSGTMFRSAGSKTLRFRTGKFEDPDLAGDLLTLPDPAMAKIDEGKDFRSVTFIAATQDNMLTPELMIDGQPHGALSWAFARALRGDADRDGDGHLSQQELLAYLVPTVQAQAENQQIPGILPLRPNVKPIMRSIAGGEAAAPAPAGGDTVTLFVRGGAPAGLADVAGVKLIEDEGAADLVWDRAAGTVTHRVGGRVADGVDDDAVTAVLSKWSAIAYVKARAASDPVSLDVPTGGQIYRVGQQFRFTMTGATKPYLTLFNLPPDGRVEAFMPETPQDVETDWRDRTFSVDLKVAKPPYGAEHMVAILTDQPAIALHKALRSMSTADRAGGLAATLRSSLADTPFQAGIISIYTEGDE